MIMLRVEEVGVGLPALARGPPEPGRIEHAGNGRRGKLIQ
jgi:hypothetical protein